MNGIEDSWAGYFTAVASASGALFGLLFWGFSSSLQSGLAMSCASTVPSSPCGSWRRRFWSV